VVKSVLISNPLASLAVKIRRIEITNLRAIDRLELDLAPLEGRALDLAVLAGPNGCGKTSVLEACLWALQADKLVQRPLPEQDFLIQLVVEHDGDEYLLERSPRDGVVRGPDIDDQAAPNRRKMPDWVTVHPIYFSSWRAPRLIGSVGLSTSQPKRHSPVKQGETLSRLKQYLVNLKATSAFGDFNGADFPRAEQVFERLGALWAELYPGAGGCFDAVVVEPPTGDSGPKADREHTELGPMYDLVLRDRARPGGIRVDELSSGEIEALSMIGAFVMSRVGYDLVLVDEPELHLHPAWHRAILRVLRRAAPAAQIICATHSEHVLDSVYSHQRFTLLTQGDPRLRLASAG
jgi:ABC-type branched-subunit amino acid transport system ATPase component